MVREADQLTYLAADGTEGFKKLLTYDFGSEDTTDIRCVASTGGPGASLDVRFSKIEVRTDEILQFPTVAEAAVGKSQADTKESATKGSLALVLIVGFGSTLLLALLLAAWIYSRRRHQPKPPNAPGEKTEGSLLLTCSQCNKKLKVSAGLIGKRIKCPSCSHAVSVTAD